MKAFVSTIGFISISILLFCGCKKDDENLFGKTDLEKFLPGKWQLMEISGEGKSISHDPFVETYSWTSLESLIFKSGGHKINHQFFNYPGQDSLEILETRILFYSSHLTIESVKTSGSNQAIIPFSFIDSTVSKDLKYNSPFINNGPTKLEFSNFNPELKVFSRRDQSRTYSLTIQSVNKKELIVRKHTSDVNMLTGYNYYFSSISKYQRIK